MLASDGGATESSADAAPTADASSPPEEDANATVPAGARLRLPLAIERVSADAVKAALAPRKDEKDEPMKWAVVCAESAQGLQPGDPAFVAWVRLAATPVRDVKRELAIFTGEAPPRDRRSDGPRGRRPPDRPGGGDRSRPGGTGGGGDRSRPGGGPGGRSSGRSGPPGGDLRDGTFSNRIRIVTDDREERRASERARKEQRDAKLKADRERLARLGY